MSQSKKSSLVILYHREPHDEVVENGQVHYRPKKSPNGIVPTLKNFFAWVDQGTWIAWKAAEHGEPDWPERVQVEDGSGYTVRRIPLTQQQISDFYHITSKEAFWPILHSFPYHFTYESSNWENFHEVNRRFAEAAVAEASDDALIWVHDYNLWLAPHYIRQLKPNARIAFFHHTPFPAPDVFNILPWREEIVDSLLECDMVGFHIPRYAENFVNVARSLRPVKALERKLLEGHMTPVGAALAEPEVTTKLGYKGREVHVDAFPVGTNPQQILDRLHSPEGKAKVEEIRREMDGRKLILSVGRVDYVKGTRELLEAYERLLARREDLHGKVRLMVTSVASAKGMRIYEKPQREIESLVGRINGKYSSFDWTPAVLTTNPIPFENLVCYFKAADICWITPLRDGLNLVNKEYVIAKEGEAGVSILSEFTGAAVELPDAILTNPYSQDRMDASIDEALAMSEQEQRERMGRMDKIVKDYDAQRWADHLFNKLGFKVEVPA